MCVLRLLLTCDEKSPCVRINGGKPREMLANLRIDFKIKPGKKTQSHIPSEVLSGRIM